MFIAKNFFALLCLLVSLTVFAASRVERPLQQILDYKLADISLGMPQQQMQDVLRKQGFNKVSYGGSKDAVRGWVFQKNKLTVNIEFAKGAVNKIRLTDRSIQDVRDYQVYISRVRKRWLIGNDELFCRQELCEVHHMQGYYRLNAGEGQPLTEEVARLDL